MPAFPISDVPVVSLAALFIDGIYPAAAAAYQPACIHGCSLDGTGWMSLVPSRERFRLSCTRSN